MVLKNKGSVYEMRNYYSLQLACLKSSTFTHCWAPRNVKFPNSGHRLKKHFKLNFGKKNLFVIYNKWFEQTQIDTVWQEAYFWNQNRCSFDNKLANSAATLVFWWQFDRARCNLRGQFTRFIYSQNWILFVATILRLLQFVSILHQTTISYW